MSLSRHVPTPRSAAPLGTTHGLSLQVDTSRGVRAVRMAGRLVVGAGVGHPVWAALGRELGRDLLLDLSGLSAIDAAGVGRLLDTHARLAARGAHLSVTATSPRVGHVLERVGLSRQLLASLPTPPRPATTPAALGTELCACGR